MTGRKYIVPPFSRQHLPPSNTPASSLCTLTRFADTCVPLPLVWTAAVAGARRRDAGVANITAGLYFDSSWWAWQGRRVRPYTQPNALWEEKESVYVTDSLIKKKLAASFVYWNQSIQFLSIHPGFHLLFANISSFPPPIHLKNSIHPSSPVCILLSRFEPLQSPALLPHADVSPSNHESHFPL